MAYDRIQHTNHTAQISGPKSGQGKFRSRSAIQRAVRHNHRLGDKPGRNETFDPARKHLNKDLLEKSQEDIYLNLMNRLTGESYTEETVPNYGTDRICYQDGKKIRTSQKEQFAQVLAFELETTYPGDLIWCDLDASGNAVPVPEGTIIDQVAVCERGKECTDENGNPAIGKGYFRMPLNKAEFDEWCKSTVEFAKERFGDENVVSAQLHMDENKPHIHFICTPVTKDEHGIERLRYNEMLGGLDSYDRLQSEYASAVAHLNYKRGEQNSIHINQINTKEYKIRLSKAMDKEMPETLEKAKEVIKDQRVKIFTLEEDIKEITVSAHKFQKVRNTNDKLREENQKLKQQLEEKNQLIQKQRENIILEENRRRCIEDGKRISNPSVVAAYEKMENEFQNSGLEHLLSMGYEKEELRFWEEPNIGNTENEIQRSDINK